MNNDELKRMIESFADKNGVNPNEIKKSANKDMADKLMKSLNEKQAQQVKNIMNDPEKTKEILNSPQAQAIIKRLMGNG